MRDEPYKVCIKGVDVYTRIIQNRLLPGFTPVNDIKKADGLIVVLLLDNEDAMKIAREQIKTAQRENPDIQVLLLGRHDTLNKSQKALSRDLLGIAVGKDTVHYRRMNEQQPGTIISALQTLQAKITNAKEDAHRNLPFRANS